MSGYREEMKGESKFGPTERMLLRFGLVIGFIVGSIWGCFLFWAATR